MVLKVKWIPMIVEEWYKDLPSETFWIIKGNNSTGKEMGYFKGYDELNDDDVSEFLDNINCYYFHGESCNIDGSCNCKKLEENDLIYFSSINICNSNQIEYGLLT